MYKTYTVQHLSIGFVTLMIWAAAVGGATFWWLQLGDVLMQPSISINVTKTDRDSADARMMARALGAHENVEGEALPVLGDPDLAGRVALQGVLTQRAGGAALIAVDGGPARPVRVGALVGGLSDGWTLREVRPHSALLATGARELVLQMPPMEARSRNGDAVASDARQPMGVVPRRIRTGGEQSLSRSVPAKSQSR